MAVVIFILIVIVCIYFITIRISNTKTEKINKIQNQLNNKELEHNGAYNCFAYYTYNKDDIEHPFSLSKITIDNRVQDFLDKNQKAKELFDMIALNEYDDAKEPLKKGAKLIVICPEKILIIGQHMAILYNLTTDISRNIEDFLNDIKISPNKHRIQVFIFNSETDKLLFLNAVKIMGTGNYGIYNLFDYETNKSPYDFDITFIKPCMCLSDDTKAKADPFDEMSAFRVAVNEATR